MRHIKKFESFEEEKFDLGNYPVEDTKDADCEPCEDGDEFPGGEWYPEDEFNPEDYEGEEEREEEAEEHERRRLWGDESTVERISSFRQFEAKKAKPDFLDLDKDGDKKESMKKAAKDAKEDKKDNKKEDKKDNKKEEKKEETKGLSAAQKKLPPALQKAIAARKKK
jgi:hypothetical protein